MEKINSFLKTYLGLTLGPVFFVIFGIGVLLVIISIFFGNTEWYNIIATWFSTGAAIILIPSALIVLLFGLFINPIKGAIKWIKSKF